MIIQIFLKKIIENLSSHLVIVSMWLDYNKPGLSFSTSKKWLGSFLYSLKNIAYKYNTVVVEPNKIRDATTVYYHILIRTMAWPTRPLLYERETKDFMNKLQGCNHIPPLRYLSSVFTQIFSIFQKWRFVSFFPILWTYLRNLHFNGFKIIYITWYGLYAYTIGF